MVAVQSCGGSPAGQVLRAVLVYPHLDIAGVEIEPINNVVIIHVLPEFNYRENLIIWKSHVFIGKI